MTTRTQHGQLPDVADPEFSPYWDGTRIGDIRVPHCAECSRSIWPPRPICPSCHAQEIAWRPVATTGRLYSWTVAQHSTVDGMEPGYVVAIVEIDESPQIRMLGNIWDADPEGLQIGASVTARFHEVSDGCTLVNWSVNAS